MNLPVAHAISHLTPLTPQPTRSRPRAARQIRSRHLSPIRSRRAPSPVLTAEILSASPPSRPPCGDRRAPHAASLSHRTARTRAGNDRARALTAISHHLLDHRCIHHATHDTWRPSSGGGARARRASRGHCCPMHLRAAPLARCAAGCPQSSVGGLQRRRCA